MQLKQSTAVDRPQHASSCRPQGLALQHRRSVNLRAVLHHSNSSTHESADCNLAAAKAHFLQHSGQQYGYQGWLDSNYEAELGCRLGPGQHYLDWTGNKKLRGLLHMQSQHAGQVVALRCWAQSLLLRCGSHAALGLAALLVLFCLRSTSLGV